MSIYDAYLVTCEAAPLQIEGFCNGRSFYFRARHGRWTLDCPPPDPGGFHTIASGETEPEFGEAVEIIREAMYRLPMPQEFPDREIP